MLALQNISVAYRKRTILENFNLEIEKGKLISLLGPSGCGKTTTLRLMAGLVKAKSGKVIFHDKDYTKVPVNKRNVGFVFQHDVLYPQLTIFNNIAFALKLRKFSEREIKKRVMELLEIVKMTGFESRFPSELSGGQKQRIAIARAIVIEPDILLMDEPFSHLDANLRQEMKMEIRQIQQKLGITTVFVSHDPEECLAISDQVAIMNRGNIEQYDDPAAIYHHPRTKFVADFIGYKNFIKFDGWQRDGNHLVLSKSGYVFVTRETGHDNLAGKIGTIRPEDLRMEEGHLTERIQQNRIPGRIKHGMYLGRMYEFTVETPIGEFIVHKRMVSPYRVGEKITLILPKERLVLVE